MSSSVTLKACNKCNKEKKEVDFSKDINYKSGYSNVCKQCKYDYNKLPHVKKRRAELRKIRNKNKIKTDIEKQKEKEYKRIWYLKNKTRLIPIYKKYRETHKEQINDYFRERKKKDPNYKLKCNLRSRLWEYLTRRNYIKGCKFSEYLGCSIDQLKSHIEKQFQPGMTWDNYGEWHVDHIIELNTVKTKKELYKLFHYTNLQPLWAADNIGKSNKLCHRK